MTILVSHGIPAEGLEALGEHRVLIPHEGRAYTRDELKRLLPETDVMLCCGRLDAELLQTAARLKGVVCYGAGYDGIDIAAATRLGIPVCNIPDTVTEATAELAITLMLALSRRICELDTRLRQEKELAFGMGKRMGRSLTGRTLGVVGLGRIGRRVAEFGRFAGMVVLYSTHSPKTGADWASFVPLDELLARSDVVSLHCPLTPETDGLLDERRLGLMKPDALLVNTARGRVVDMDALVLALLTGWLGGAALDVFPNEPRIDERLLMLPNVLLTPHIGSNTLEARRLMAQEAARRLLLFLSGQRPPDLLNPEALS